MTRTILRIAVIAAVPAEILRPAAAGDVDVVAAHAEKRGEHWRFTVTLRHADEGWDHYADAWRVVAPDGAILGVRELAHPHVNEQPFTRSLSGVRVPVGVSQVRIEARDTVHGWSPDALTLNLDD